MSSKCLFRCVRHIRKAAQGVYQNAPHAIAALIGPNFLALCLFVGLLAVPGSASAQEPAGATAAKAVAWWRNMENQGSLGGREGMVAPNWRGLGRSGYLHWRNCSHDLRRH